MPVGAYLQVVEGDVHPGKVIAKIPRETTKMKDTTGGLPRVAELFEPESRRSFRRFGHRWLVSFGRTAGKRRSS